MALITNLKNVAQNLYRHKTSRVFFAGKKINGRHKFQSLETTDRQTADGKLSQWLREVQSHTPRANQDLTMEQLLARFLAARAGKKASTRETESGFAKKMRESFDALGKGMNLPFAQCPAIRISKRKHERHHSVVQGPPLQTASGSARFRRISMQSERFPTPGPTLDIPL